MKTLTTFCLFALLLVVPAAAQQNAKPAAKDPNPTAIPANSSIYIEPMNGYGNYLAAAFEKKHVPLLIVNNEKKADFVVSGVSTHHKAGWAKIVFMGNVHSNDAASITITNQKSGVVAFAYAVNKKNSWHGLQSAAEACAKHLKNYMEKNKE